MREKLRKYYPAMGAGLGLAVSAYAIKEHPEMLEDYLESVKFIGFPIIGCGLGYFTAIFDEGLERFFAEYFRPKMSELTEKLIPDF